MTLSPSRTGALLGALVAPAALGVSATAVSLPALGADLALSPPRTAWVLAAYVLTQAIGTAVLGRVADRTGTRRVLLLGVAAALLGSVVAATAQSFGTLVAGRLLQGLGVGGVGIAAFAIIARRFDAPGRGRALGALTAVIGIVSGGGTLIGGAVTELVSWRWTIALPALTVLAAAPALRLATGPPRVGPAETFDVRGAAAVSLAVAGVVVLVQARSTGLTTGVVLAVVAGTAAAAGVVGWTAARRPAGFLPRPVLTSSAFRLGTLAGSTLFAGYLALLFAAPQLLGVGRGRTTLEVGLVLLPAAAFASVTARVVPLLAARTGSWRLVSYAGLVSATGLLLAASLGDRAAVVVVTLTLVVSGFVAAQVVLGAELPALVPGPLRGAATGVFQLLFLLGGAVGSALTGALSDVVTLRAALAVVAAVPLLGAVLAVLAGGAVREPEIVPQPRSG